MLSYLFISDLTKQEMLKSEIAIYSNAIRRDKLNGIARNT